jgi:hypothetical protein
MVDIRSGDSSETVRRVQGPSRGNLLPEVRLDCRGAMSGVSLDYYDICSSAAGMSKM